MAACGCGKCPQEPVQIRSSIFFKLLTWLQGCKGDFCISPQFSLSFKTLTPRGGNGIGEGQAKEQDYPIKSKEFCIDFSRGDKWLMKFWEIICSISVKFLPSFPLKINDVFIHLWLLSLGLGVKWTWCESQLQLLSARKPRKLMGPQFCLQ